MRLPAIVFLVHLCMLKQFGCASECKTFACQRIGDEDLKVKDDGKHQKNTIPSTVFREIADIFGSFMKEDTQKEKTNKKVSDVEEAHKKQLRKQALEETEKKLLEESKGEIQKALKEKRAEAAKERIELYEKFDEIRRQQTERHIKDTQRAWAKRTEDARNIAEEHHKMKDQQEKMDAEKRLREQEKLDQIRREHRKEYENRIDETQKEKFRKLKEKLDGKHRQEEEREEEAHEMEEEKSKLYDQARKYAAEQREKLKEQMGEMREKRKREMNERMKKRQKQMKAALDGDM